MVRLAVLATVLAFAGCDLSIPGIDTNMDELAPWTNVPETETLRYLEKYRRPAMEPRFLAAATFQNPQDIEKLVSYFDLKLVSAIQSAWPTSFQPADFTLDESVEMYSATMPMRRSNDTVIVINLWIDHQRKILVIEKNWELGGNAGSMPSSQSGTSPRSE